MEILLGVVFAVLLFAALIRLIVPWFRRRLVSNRHRSDPTTIDTPAAAPAPAESNHVDTVSPRQNQEQNAHPPDKVDRLEVVRTATFNPKQLIRPAEQPVLLLLENIIANQYTGYRVMSKPAMGEFLWAQLDDAFQAINCKRPDFLVIDADFRPVLVVEYQGKGHDWSPTYKTRDETKRVALSSASVPLLEIPAKYDAEQIELQVRSLLRPS